MRSNLADLPVFDLPDSVRAIGAHANASGHVVVTNGKPFPSQPWPRQEAKPPAPQRRAPQSPPVSSGAVLITLAGLLLLALAVAMGITSFHAQFAYILPQSTATVRSILEALGLDCGAVIFSLLGIALARLGRRAVVERVLVVLCALGSCGMNALNANLGSPRSVAVWAMPPILFALTSDRLVSVIRRAALGPKADEDSQRSAWRMFGIAVLYGLRFVLAPPSTAVGARQAVLNATPLPDAPARQRLVLPLAELAPAAGKTAGTVRMITPRAADATRKPRTTGKQARFLALVADRHGELTAIPLDKVGKIATDLAPEVDLNVGQARKVLRGAVLNGQDGGAS